MDLAFIYKEAEVGSTNRVGKTDHRATTKKQQDAAVQRITITRPIYLCLLLLFLFFFFAALCPLEELSLLEGGPEFPDMPSGVASRLGLP